VTCRYFEDDDDEHKTLSELEYQPAPGSPTLDRMNAAAANQKEDDSSSDSSDDPLDSFMADIEAMMHLMLYSHYLLLADCITAHSRNGYWHDAVICLSVCDAVHCG